MSLDQENKDIKFPESHYVGFQVREGVDGVPLGFMTPDGKDQAATKRKTTVDNWVKGYGNTKTLPAKTFENKPMSGFKLGRNVRHGYGWGQGNVKWRIEDPRGFELEISSPNLAAILECATIEKGEILEKCMWARLKGDNILVPVSSDVYKAAQENSERVSKSASLKDLKPGNGVVLQNGTVGIFVGAFYTLTKGSYSRDKSPRWGDKKRFFVRTETDTDDGKATSYEVIASMKLSEIDSSTSSTLEAGEKEINEFASKRSNGYFDRLREPGNDYRSVIAVSALDPKKSEVKMVHVPVDLADAVKDLTISYGTTYNESWLTFDFHDASGAPKMALFSLGDAQTKYDAYLAGIKAHGHSSAWTPRIQDTHLWVIDRSQLINDQKVVIEQVPSRFSYQSDTEDRTIAISCEKLLKSDPSLFGRVDMIVDMPNGDSLTLRWG